MYNHSKALTLTILIFYCELSLIQCENEWMSPTNSNIEYKFIPYCKTFAESQLYCETIGANLASTSTNLLREFVYKLAYAASIQPTSNNCSTFIDVYVGGETNEKNVINWYDGTTTAFFDNTNPINWDTNEPDMPKEQIAIGFKLTTKKWYTSYPTETLAHICQRFITNSPTTRGGGNTIIPANTPIKQPTKQPSILPTSIAPTTTTNPSVSPTNDPTIMPSSTPSQFPSKNPTFLPTKAPTNIPTVTPTNIPTHIPTLSPVQTPTYNPTHNSIEYTTINPSNIPTVTPTQSQFPTHYPSNIPSKSPTTHPTTAPTRTLSQSPSNIPTLLPTKSPINAATVTTATFNPSVTPTKAPITNDGIFTTDSTFSSTSDSISTNNISDIDSEVLTNTKANSAIIYNVFLFAGIGIIICCCVPLVLLICIKLRADMNKEKTDNLSNVITAHTIPSVSRISTMSPVSSTQTRGYTFNNRNDNENVMQINKLTMLKHTNTLESVTTTTNETRTSIKSVIDNEILIEDVKNWLTYNVELPQYFDIFINNGYDSLAIIKVIGSISELKEIGISNTKHQYKIMKEIYKLMNIPSPISPSSVNIGMDHCINGNNVTPISPYSPQSNDIIIKYNDNNQVISGGDEIEIVYTNGKICQDEIEQKCQHVNTNDTVTPDGGEEEVEMMSSPRKIIKGNKRKPKFFHHQAQKTNLAVEGHKNIFNFKENEMKSIPK